MFPAHRSLLLPLLLLLLLHPIPDLTATGTGSGKKGTARKPPRRISLKDRKDAANTPATNKQSGGDISKKPASKKKPPKKGTVITKKTLDFWSQTMQFGTPEQKKDVLQRMRFRKHPRIIPILLKALEDESHQETKKKIIQILYEKKAKQALPILLKNLDQADDPDTLSLSLSAIGELQDKTAVKKILPFLKHDQPLVVQAAVDALAKLKAKNAGKTLLAMLKKRKTSDDVKYRIIVALGEIAYAPAYKTLRKIALSKSAPRGKRSLAITALGQLKNNAILPDFFKILKKESNVVIKIRVIHALGIMGSKQAVKYLITAMKDANPALRKAAIDTAAKIKAPGTKKALLYKLRYDPNPQVMVAAAQALQRLKDDQLGPIVLEKFDSYRDTKVLYPLLKIIKELKPPNAVSVLKEKQKTMRFDRIKDEIEKVLDSWGKGDQPQPKTPKSKKNTAANKKSARSARNTPATNKQPQKIILKQ